MSDVVSLFSGLGGLDLGLEEAGWNCVYATDIDPCAIRSLEANKGLELSNGNRFLQHALIEQSDIRVLYGKQLLSDIDRRRGDITLLAGGPPCQSWSSAGHQLGFDDPRGRLIAEYLRIASELDCRYLLFENVRGLVTARGADGMPGSAISWLREQLFRLGWQTHVELFNAADYGVPQRRVRVMLIGYRTGDAPCVPVPTHSKSPAEYEQSWISMASCLGGLAPLTEDEIIRPSGKLALELASIMPGSGVKSLGKQEATRPGGHWGYKQGAFVAEPNIPARTVTANPQQDWIRDPFHGLRRLTPRECAALQTFPETWHVVGKRIDQYRLIGNAVPPKLAAAVGGALLASYHQPEVEAKAVAELTPLPHKLQSAIDYTQREERRNGPSRRAAPVKRRVRISA